MAETRPKIDNPAILKTHQQETTPVVFFWKVKDCYKNKRWHLQNVLTFSILFQFIYNLYSVLIDLKSINQRFFLFGPATKTQKQIK